MKWHPITEPYPEGVWLWLTKDPEDPEMPFRILPSITQEQIILEFPEITHWSPDEC